LDAALFSYSAAHVTYIAAAIRQSVSDVSDGAGKHFFRACDPDLTKPRVGDLYCYHRHVEGTRYSYEQKGPSLFRSLFRDFLGEEQPIWLSHCDIVVRIDDKAKKVTVIGGNVQNSVTERVLNLNRKGALSSSQGTKACESYNPETVRTGEPNCNLNSQEWFVLLQARM
jgi:hypothetical protein